MSRKKDERTVDAFPDRDGPGADNDGPKPKGAVDRCPAGGNHHWAVRTEETDESFVGACSKCQGTFSIKKNIPRSRAWLGGERG